MDCNVPGARAVVVAEAETPTAEGVGVKRSASVVSRIVLTIAKRTRVQSSFVGQTWGGWGPFNSREQTIEPSGASEMHSTGAIVPSSASTTSAIVIFEAGRASR